MKTKTLHQTVKFKASPKQVYEFATVPGVFGVNHYCGALQRYH